MNNDTVAGKFDQLKGQVKQGVGEAIGNDRLANEGTADRVKGAAKEAWGNTKDAAAAVSDRVHANAADREAAASTHTSDTAHNLRESIANGAENVKNAVNRHADNVKYDNRS